MMTTMVMMMMKMMISLDKPTILGIERAGQQEEKHSSPLLNWLGLRLVVINKTKWWWWQVQFFFNNRSRCLTMMIQMRSVDLESSNDDYRTEWNDMLMGKKTKQFWMYVAFITGWKSNCVDIVAIWFHHFCVLLILVPPFQAMFQFNLQSLRFKNSHRQKSSQGCRFWVLVKAFSSDQHRVGSCIIFGNMIGRSEKCIRQ